MSAVDVDSDKNKKLYIKTWGCQMNVYDSNRMADILSPFGYQTVDKPDNADMIILNTCHIREKATEKVFSEIGRLKQYKKSYFEKTGEKTLLAVAGCVAQAEGDEITRRAPDVDLVFGPQTYHKLPEMIAELTGSYGKRRIVNTDFPVESKFDYLPGESEKTDVSAFLSIQEGCDKFCTFCVVPYTRGAEFSRPVTDILDEAKRLIDSGAKEISLLGQNVNAFHGEGPDGRIWRLGRLIEAIAALPGIQRIRYTTSHPRDMNDELYAAHRDIEILQPYLHLPVQSGSDKILKLMNRKHSSDDYRRIVDRLREARPDIAMSSDFIVGFPGETSQDFEDTLQLVRDITFAQAYSFKFSARPGTPAANMQSLVHESIKSDRLARLQALLNEQQEAFNKATVGKTVTVLFDRTGQKEGQLLGRSPWMQAVHAKAPKRLRGQIVEVKIEESFANSLSGKIVTTETIINSNNNNIQSERRSA